MDTGKTGVHRADSRLRDSAGISRPLAHDLHCQNCSVRSFLVLLLVEGYRLKEIMEYTSSTPQGTLGEYLALVDRENLSLSDIDEQSDSQEL